MSGLVTVAVAADAIEADGICAVLRQVGIEPSVEGAETEAGAEGDGPCRVLVEAEQLEFARQALEAEEEEEDDV